MKTEILFPHRLKIPSLLLFLPSILLLITMQVFHVDMEWLTLEVSLPVLTDDPLFGERRFFVWVEREISYLILLTLTIISGVVFAFSREKQEDEMIGSIRKDSLIWAFYFNYAVLIFSLFAFAGFDLFLILALNILSLLLFFIIRFEWQKRRLNLELHAE